MLGSLGTGLRDAFKRIAGLGVVDREAVESVVRELQRALLQSDVDVKLVSELSARIRERVLKDKPPAGMTLKEHFIKMLYDELVGLLGAEKGEVPLKKQRVLVVGLFGSGKSTTCGKLAKWFKTRGMSVGLVACDTHRAAAQEQLRQIASRVDVHVYDQGKSPQEIANNALKASKDDILIFDTAGRDALDKELAKELKELGSLVKADEVLLVIPADIGQAARRQSEEFNKLVGITGIIITKLDGTARGGGALAAAHVSGAAVKFIGVGEKVDDFESYDPKRFMGRLIGYGDIEGLLEKAKSAGVEVDEGKAKRLMEGKFTMDDFYEQLGQMGKMGSLSKMMEMVPGMGQMKIPKDMMDVQEGRMKKWKFIIESMTRQERENPDEIKASRITRMARGSGTAEADVRALLKSYKQAQKFMKMAKGGKGLKRGPLAALAKQFGAG
jgi:signal recognition particle subunit SRP54